LLNHAIRFGNHFGCILLDVDHFKSLNDQHGHAMGDEVLKGVATRIQGQIRQSDILCRYGGEEFCLLLIDQKIAQTTAVAERIRQCLSETPINGQQVTASLGVTTTEFHVTDTQRLIQRADEALYAAKRSGRNRVCRWDQIAAVDLSNDEVAPRAVSHFGEEHFPWIPFHTVQAVFSLLLLRSLPVAEHCRRVADACVLAGENLLSAPDLYLVEVAALLHEIGKMGLPDALLLKRGAMTPDDQQIIEFYERVGCDLLQAAFDCAQLDAAVAAVRRGKQRQRLSVDDLTPAARLLVIADEYDQLTYDRDGRRQLADDLACQQLKRLADPRLDPRLVNYFADRVAAREAIRGTHHPHVNLQPLSEIESNILNELKSIHDQLREREIVTESTIRALSQLGR
jgi:diguanylate cyclase (GGDEF)-like protein